MAAERQREGSGLQEAKEIQGSREGPRETEEDGLGDSEWG